MSVEFFNLPYFIFLFAGIGIIVGLFFLLRKRSDKTKKIVLLSLLIFNLLLHLSKFFMAPYNESLQSSLETIFAVNICAASVYFFPFIFISKNKGAKDFMFYLGCLSGFLALLIPTEALGENLWQIDIFRFYTAHILLLAVPFLMVVLKLHALNYRRIWQMPLYMIAFLMFIMVNQVVQAEMGIINPRSADFLNVNYPNPSFFWKRSDDSLFAIFDTFTPNFLKTVPVGPCAGQPKYWPLLWIFPSLTFYFLTFPFFMSIPFEYKRMIGDAKNIGRKTKKIFTRKKVKDKELQVKPKASIAKETDAKETDKKATVTTKKSKKTKL